MKHEKIHIGTSGWSYKHWRGTFYPQELKVKDHFSYYLKNFNTVEINATFYRLPAAATFLNWKKMVPSDFIYVIKASRYITHIKKMHDPAESLAGFMDHVKELGSNLGPILFQLPPFMKCNVPLLERFIAALPQKYRYVFEFRNSDWYRAEVYAVLKKHNCAFCIYELAGHMAPFEVTADFVYLRLHGPGNKYQGSYSDQALQKWAGECLKWSQTKQVFVYFDNDQNAYAAFNALKLSELINAN